MAPSSVGLAGNLVLDMVSLNLYWVDLRSWQSVVIMIATFSRYTHSAIQVGDRIFEASGKRKTVGWDDPNLYQGRRCKKIVLNISEQKATEILNKFEGIKYDQKALHFWIFAMQSDGKHYCFENAWFFLREGLLLNLMAPYALKRYTARKLLKYI